MKYSAIFFLSFFILFSKQVCFGQNIILHSDSVSESHQLFSDSVPLFDSAAITKIKPNALKEQKIFSDPSLKYNKKSVVDKSFFERFLDWFAETFFGGAGYENIYMARKIMIWSIVIASVTIIIWLLSKSELVSLIKPKPKTASFNFNDITEDLDAINFNEKISEALNNSEFRLAIRWQYLKTLFLLDKKQIIVFAPHKTNIDYGTELKGKLFYDTFIKLSRIYEYVWYGEFALKESVYKINSLEFEKMEKQINV